MNKPEQLIDGYIHDSLDETRLIELQQWLSEKDSNIHMFTEALMLDEEIRASIRSRENTNAANELLQRGTPEQQPGQPIQRDRQSNMNKPRLLSRAAV